MSSEEILYETKDVYIHEPKCEDENDRLIESKKVGGRLQFVKNKYSKFIRFLPYGCEASSDDWALIGNTPTFTYSKEDSDSVGIKSNNANNKYKLQFDFKELSSVRRIYQNYGIGSIIFILKDGTTWPQLYFHKGGSKNILLILKKYFVLMRDPKEPRLWVLQLQDGDAFKQSLYELSLFNEQRNDVVKSFLNEPIQSTFLSFSKVTNILRGALKPSEQQLHSSNAANLFDLDPKNNPLFNSVKTDNQVDDDLNDLMDSMSSENIHSTNNDGYEMVTKVDLGPMPTVTRGPFVDKTVFEFDDEGRVLNVDRLKSRIFRGGVEPSLRNQLWKFLLNYYDWNSTHKERAIKRELREKDYFRMKLQWKTVSEEQKIRFSQLRDRENLIDKDVQRTDRTHSYFQGDDNQNLDKMRDILMTYNMFNFDLGYVQGMSDLLAPIMVMMDNEVDSFWSFVGFMDKIESNFFMDQSNIKLQLNNLKILLEFVDSKFSSYLESNDSSNMYFCFRWLLILFKREFSFPDIMHLWEVLWTDLPCKNFHLLICIAILLMKKDDIMTNRFGFNEILKFINDLAYRIDLNKTLEYAEGLYLQIKNFKNLPSNVSEIVGLEADQIDNELDDELINLTDEMTCLSPKGAQKTVNSKSPSKSKDQLNKSLSPSANRKEEDSIESLN